MSLAVFLVLQEAIRAYSRPNYRSRFTEIGGEWARYLSAKSERKSLQRRSIFGQFLSSLALLLMVLGITFVVTSKHQLGLFAWPLSIHGAFGAATVVLLTFKVVRTLILPLCCPVTELRSARSCTTRVLSTSLFVLAYASAFLGVRELYSGHIWSGRTLLLFLVLTTCSVSIESLSLCLVLLPDRATMTGGGGLVVASGGRKNNRSDGDEDDDSLDGRDRFESSSDISSPISLDGDDGGYHSSGARRLLLPSSRRNKHRGTATTTSNATPFVNERFAGFVVEEGL